MISLQTKAVDVFLSKNVLSSYADEYFKSLKSLEDNTGKGNDFLGWLTLPSSITEEEIIDIEATAKKIQSKCDFVIVVGIGGSYLGAKAVIDSLSNSFDWLLTERKTPVIIYAGQNIGEDYLYELTQLLKGKSFGIINISKSGTTTEPALAFRILKQQLENQVGKDEANERIIAITDASKGALRSLATQKGYKTFVIPDNVGGRFSVLTPVGLLPIAIAGCDIRALIAGAVEMERNTSSALPIDKNMAGIYAAYRNELYRSGKKIEILVNYHPKLQYFSEWWKQLYGESEGKENKGIFTASVNFTTDLHSMGQWIQDGERTIFETVLSVDQQQHCIEVPTDKEDLDGLNFLVGKRVDYINKMAELGTKIAHIDGGVPVMGINIPVLDAHNVGQLIYFFEKACGISGYMLGVNPFDQPGVEAYKKNMFALLEKPGFEEATKEIKKRV